MVFIVEMTLVQLEKIYCNKDYSLQCLELEN
jgi:hypothetical protein